MGRMVLGDTAGRDRARLGVVATLLATALIAVRFSQVHPHALCCCLTGFATHFGVTDVAPLPPLSCPPPCAMTRAPEECTAAVAGWVPTAPLALSRCCCWSWPSAPQGAGTARNGSHFAASLSLPTTLSRCTTTDGWSATMGGVRVVAASTNSLPLLLCTLLVGAAMLLLLLPPLVLPAELLVKEAAASQDLDMFSNSSAKSIWLSLL